MNLPCQQCFVNHSSLCSRFPHPDFCRTKCHLLYLTQQPVTNWAIYTGLALGWARDLHYLRGQQRCSWVSIRALDLQRREELPAISLSGVVRHWGGEFTRTPIPLQFWRIQTLNLKIAFIVTPKTGLMVQLVRNLRKHWNSPITSAQVNNVLIAVSSLLGRGNVIESMCTHSILNYWRNSSNCSRKTETILQLLKVHHLKVQLKDWKPCKIMNNHKYKFTIALD